MRPMVVLITHQTSDSRVPNTHLIIIITIISISIMSIIWGIDNGGGLAIGRSRQ